MTSVFEIIVSFMRRGPEGRELAAGRVLEHVSHPGVRTVVGVSRSVRILVKGGRAEVPGVGPGVGEVFGLRHGGEHAAGAES